ncbi:hypothetical protein CTP10_R46380 [Cupriavidus sp. P-10]|uniref:hypothetical protein n=1 Tax=Cupriavidus sp. P-10 TaxID=2027911 RepID=UPI0011C145E1|nr:hypothetical protein [Cupriavidus sp. P-10]BDB27233.1 hypothetical protein CTP10_R46380 [Cupriavidus sp. P-10]
MTYPTPMRGGRAALIRRYSDEKYAKSKGQLFLLYSPTINDDVLLIGDAEFVLWMIAVEMDPRVKAIDYRPEPPGMEKSAEHATFVLTLSEGFPAEVHYISDTLERSDVQSSFADDYSIVIHRKKDLRKHVPLIQRYHQLTCFAAAIRDYACAAEQNALLHEIAQRERGSISDLATALPNIEQPILFGIVSRLVANGTIIIDLTLESFSLRTMWTKR